MSNAKKKDAEQADPKQPNLNVINGGADAPSDDDIPTPPRANADILPIVAACAESISLPGNDDKVKNYCATADYVLKEIAMKLARHWPKILKTANENALDESDSKIAKVSIGIEMDLTSPSQMKTGVTFKLARKAMTDSSSTEEDLRQINFKLGD